MKKRRQLNFREVLDYQRSKLLGYEGMFLPKVVSTEHLPKEIYFYYLQKERRGGYYSFSKRNERRTAGMFFTNEDIEMKGNIHYLTKEDDFQIFEELISPEEFVDYFKVKLSLDKQISLADEKRFAVPEEEEEETDGNFIFKGKQGQY